jgi:hypothetical protein
MPSTALHGPQAKGNPAEHVEDQHDDGLKGNISSKTTERVRSVALAEALAYENPRPFRRSFIRLYLCLVVAYMCSSTNGFDANTFGKKICSVTAALNVSNDCLKVASPPNLTSPTTLISHPETMELSS